MPKTKPENPAIPGRPKKKRFPTTPENHVQNSKRSAAINDPPTLRRSRGVKKCSNVMRSIPESSQPNALDNGISGWNGM
jgi:hypothetical protein